MADLNIPLKYFTNLEKRAKYKLIKRYDKPLSYHDVKIINDILYNEKTHYVEQFKEYLIYEDYNEFLKRFYKTFELKIKLPKILTFYEKYSKIYANYTVIPESKYMYKNIKRKQKMIDQMQNNNIDSEYECFDNSNDDMSNTIFRSKIMNSIYRRTLTLNKSDNGNSEQSINNFVNKINDIENKIKNNCLKNNFVNGNKYGKSQKEIMLPMTKFNKNYLLQRHTPKSTKINANNKNEQNSTNRTNSNNNNQKNKIIDIQFTYSKKNLQNELNKNKTNYNNNINGINKNNNNINNPNLIFINSYVHKNSNNNTIFSNNKSLGNTNNNSNSNISNTFQGQKNSLNINNFSKQKLPTALLKQSVIKNSNNINYKENMSITHINNYFNNATNNLKNNQKYKLSLGETLLKCDKIILSTNSSVSPNIINEKVFSSPSSKTNIFNSKKQLLNDKHKNKEYINQPLSSNKITNTKKLKSQLLGEYNSVGNSLTYLSNKFLDNQSLKKINKLNKKKINKKLIDLQNKNSNQNKDNENYIYSEIQSNNNFKKPEVHRNCGHSKILSANNNTNTNNKININNNDSNKQFKITVGLKPDLKNNSQKIISSPISPSNSGSNFYYNSNLNNNKDKDKDNENVETNIKKTLEEYNKKKVIHNFNIVNNIQDNSTQINIYTGNDLYKSLHIHNNSVFNSSNLSPANTYSKSPVGVEVVGNKNKKSNLGQINSINNTNNNSFKSNIKDKDKENQNKYNLNLKKIMHKRILDGDKAIISDRQITKRKLFEKL